MDDDELIRAAMRVLAQRRRRVGGVCLVCGAAIAPSYATRRYCSNACRQRAKRARQRPPSPS